MLEQWLSRGRRPLLGRHFSRPTWTMGASGLSDGGTRAEGVQANPTRTERRTKPRAIPGDGRSRSECTKYKNEITSPFPINSLECIVIYCPLCFPLFSIAEKLNIHMEISSLRARQTSGEKKREIYICSAFLRSEYEKVWSTLRAIAPTISERFLLALRARSDVLG